MSYLSDQFLQQFLQDINKDKSIPSSLKQEIEKLHLQKKIAKGNNLKNLLNNFNLTVTGVNDEDSKS